MKIGILTLPFNNNYGGYLQSYALITVLKVMGHDVELIYRRHNRANLYKRFIYFIKNSIKISLGYKHGPLFFDEEYYFNQKGRYLRSFVEKYISPKTKPLYSSEELKDFLPDKYDAVIVGSDQVWRPIYVPNIEDYFLEALYDKKVKRIAYAASFGTVTPEYTKAQIEKCGQLIKNFDFVSIREKGGITVFKRFGWTITDVKIVLDPTMLLPAEHYVKYINVEDCQYIATYILDKDKEKDMICSIVSKKLSCKIKSILKNDSKAIPSMEHWLSFIYNSRFVITDSFHGAVFSIIFNKPFMVVVNKERGLERFKSLLGTFDLCNRIYKGTNIDEILKKRIDWGKTNNILKEEKEKSFGYLEEALA